MSHWTNEDAEAFFYSIATDFVEQIRARMKTLNMSRTKLAKLSGIEVGEVLHMLGNPGHLTFPAMIKFARALGMKVSIVAYDDHDPQNEKGPINAEVFERCWREAGKPQDFWHWNDKELSGAGRGNNSDTPAAS
jgi:hypothetical protein